MEQERRCAPRYPFIADAELSDEERTTYLQARVGDLSLSGCYLDMIHPLPAGTQIVVYVTDDSGSFQARGKIVYSLPNLGSGVAFLNVDPALLADIERSLSHAT
ncbi:MAG TPA: PilZ domain-containing protein [Candidatus Acidoferrum sp.]|nr:PilZ domain-containing protein [Candidatus Acidoferrum sp.]